MGEKQVEKDIVMIGFLAQGTAEKLAVAEEALLRKRYSQSYVERMQSAPARKCIVKEYTDSISLDNKGLFEGLWDLGEMAGSGLKVDLKKIPVRQETIELYNTIDRNPYLEPCENGALLLASDGYRLAEKLTEEGIVATVIGRLDKAKARIVVNGEEVKFLTPHREKKEET